MPIYTETKNGIKSYIVHVAKRINGKKVNRKRRNLPSKAKAERVQIELLIELERLKENPNTYTWNDWSILCIEKMKLEFKKSTVQNYEGSLKKWINPIFGEHNLEDITPSQIHNFIFNQTGNLSLETKRSILKKLRRIFSMAMYERLIVFNPTHGIKVKVPDSKRLVLNKVESATLLHKAHKIGHPFYNHWVVALLTGMRSGELYALKWTDIDFESNFISVSKAWSSKNGIGTTKTGMNRSIPICQTLKRFLLDLRGKDESSSKYVLEKLSDWTNGVQAKVLKEFCEQIGITPIKFHDLRATFITQLLLQGVAVAKVMKIVGHAELKTTMIYLRLVATDVLGATEVLNIELPESRTVGNVINLFN